MMLCRRDTSDTVAPGPAASARVAFSSALERRRRATLRVANALLSCTGVTRVSSDLFTPPLLPPSRVSSRRPAARACNSALVGSAAWLAKCLAGVVTAEVHQLRG